MSSDPLEPYKEILRRETKGDLYCRGSDIVRCAYNEHIWQQAEKEMYESGEALSWLSQEIRSKQK